MRKILILWDEDVVFPLTKDRAIVTIKRVEDSGTVDFYRINCVPGISVNCSKWNESIRRIAMERIKEKFADFDAETALMFCGDSEELFWEIMEEYCSEDKVSELDVLFSQENWKDYQIGIHALKSTSRTVGLMALGDEAEKLEMATKDEQYDYIRANHERVMALLENTTETILKIIGEGE